MGIILLLSIFVVALAGTAIYRNTKKQNQMGLDTLDAKMEDETSKKEGWFKKLQARWGVSAGRAVIILIVFAMTGTTVLFIKAPILNFIIGTSEKTWIHSIIYFILILPIYNILLLIYGSLFGQFNFFWDFEKRFFKRFVPGKKK